MLTSSPPIGPISACHSCAGLGVHREPVAVAMTVGVDLGLRAGLADERIVRRHGAVVAQTQRLADVVVERLRLHAQAVVIRSVRTHLLGVAADAIAIADRDVEDLVLAEEHAAGEVAAGLPGVGDEDLLHVPEHVALEEAARDRRASSPFSPFFGYDT